MQEKQQTMSKSNKCCRWCCIGFLIYTFVLSLIAFLVVFVAAPFIFKFSPAIQRYFVFPRDLQPFVANFSDFDYYGLKGARNFYLKVNEEQNITLGLWQILPEALIVPEKSSKEPPLYNFEALLADQSHPILLYLHGNGASRVSSIPLYRLLRKTFQIVSCDYRGYGDSSEGILNEQNFANDTVSLYKWLKARTKANIFIWGHSMGTGVAIQAAAQLRTPDVVPTGLILEAPYTSVIDMISISVFTKPLKWLPWYDYTVVQPFIHNGYGFNSTQYIVNVDCPILILHAKDDEVIPVDYAVKLEKIAVEHRNFDKQGNVTLKIYESLGYGHMYLFLAPELPGDVNEFVNQSIRFNSRFEEPATTTTATPTVQTTTSTTTTTTTTVTPPTVTTPTRTTIEDNNLTEDFLGNSTVP